MSLARCAAPASPAPRREPPRALTDVCPGHRGELRHASANHQGQEEQLGALGLIVNAIILYNTIYTQRALDHLAAHGHAIDDADVERLTPLGAGHITLDRPLPNRAPDSLRDRSATASSTRPPLSRLNPVFRMNSP